MDKQLIFLLLVIIYMIGFAVSFLLLREDIEDELELSYKMKKIAIVMLWPIMTPIYLYFYINSLYRVRIISLIILLSVLIFFIINYIKL